jgi:ABC-type bacteriocin/lantibiotic exporter with double-glycine peptidase domain
MKISEKVKKLVGQTVSESFGVLCLIAGVNAVLAGNLPLGIFLIIVGLASLFAEHYVQ